MSNNSARRQHHQDRQDHQRDRQGTDDPALTSYLEMVSEPRSPQMQSFIRRVECHKLRTDIAATERALSRLRARVAHLDAELGEPDEAPVTVSSNVLPFRSGQRGAK